MAVLTAIIDCMQLCKHKGCYEFQTSLTDTNKEMRGRPLFIDVIECGHILGLYYLLYRHHNKN